MKTRSLSPHLRTVVLATVVLFLTAGCSRGGAAPSKEGAPTAPLQEQEQVQRVLLYPAAPDMLLNEYRVEMPELGDQEKDMAELVSRYLAGPAGDDMVVPFPENCTLRAFFILNGNQAVVDLAGPVRTGGGSDTEMARVYGIVDTLYWNFNSIKSVRILVDGQEVDTLLGHLDLSRPVPYEPSMLAPSIRPQEGGGGVGEF